MKPVMMLMMLIMVVSLVFAVLGFTMQQKVSSEEAEFHALQDDYFSLSKATRDGATSGSSLNDQLVEIKNFPSDLLRLKLVGVGRILIGIYVLLFGILIALILMPIRLAMIIKDKKK